ncbi:hypothetical protein CsatB_003762 [Cannabis sativa]
MITSKDFGFGLGLLQGRKIITSFFFVSKTATYRGKLIKHLLLLSTNSSPLRM